MNMSAQEFAADEERRFGGLARLYGQDGRARLIDAHVCVVGIGGVGSWAVEALARSGIGRITLIDLDHVAESNINRQLHALDATLGQAKVDAMAERIAGYAPSCQVNKIDDFVTPENCAELLGQGFHAVIDAIDSVRTKVAMAVYAREHGLFMVSCGAAGGQIDPTRIKVCDLSRTEQDPLLARVRKQLRISHGFPRVGKGSFGIDAVYSDEPLRYPEAGEACDAARGPAGLNCAGFGSAVTVTGSFGLIAASRILNRLAGAVR